MQSPINIDTSEILFDGLLQYFDLNQYRTCHGCRMVLENVNGHTGQGKLGIIILVTLPPDSYVT